MNFRNRIKKSSSGKSKIILANDLEHKSIEKLESVTIKNIKILNESLCAIKLNFHLILPLGIKNIKKINKVAHDVGLQTIADIKLNDIGNTNMIAARRLWESGFDAIIVNPIMGPENLKTLVTTAHKSNNGIISLVHMSHPGAKLGYGLSIKHSESKKLSKLHELFLEWSLSLKTDGIVVGATVPEIIRTCHEKTKGKCEIYSPGVGTQGGDPKKALASGANYLIVGRTIFNAKDPVKEAKKLQELSIES
ncbi:MAG TPA: orotidine 5'-phosphate decarboxylase / HUMPS family protein [Nitrosopumilaceae archaeon]|nr:orotidine 5'-phosphate decarboxylase / HUMPS family protein [Nitrosopumilaceae archaeon]HXV38934.1 orotidine 5'-phosphate decarboxylase / HUMPS family protein [Nitrosopumilaceae archaeon]